MEKWFAKSFGSSSSIPYNMVDFLRQQNSKLQNEVAALKEKLEKSSGAGSSPWSRIDGIEVGRLVIHKNMTVM